MNAKSRRKIEMGRRALDFSRAHPDASPGYTAVVTQLEERLTRAEQLAGQQRDGLLEVRAATARKFELRPTGRMRGDIRASIVAIAEEAFLQGKVMATEKISTNTRARRVDRG